VFCNALFHVFLLCNRYRSISVNGGNLFGEGEGNNYFLTKFPGFARFASDEGCMKLRTLEWYEILYLDKGHEVFILWIYIKLYNLKRKWPHTAIGFNFDFLNREGCMRST
jgi:hypothetical protein